MRSFSTPNSLLRTSLSVGALALATALSMAAPAAAQPFSASQPPLQFTPQGQFDTSEEALVQRLPGFRNAYATANGVRLHYVTGGNGPPLVLLPGHPETWWVYHKMMPA